MKIAMIGSGAAGSVFASYLRAGGADMTLVDPYKAHMDAVRDNGMKFTIYPDKTTVLTGFKTAYTADEIEMCIRDRAMAMPVSEASTSTAASVPTSARLSGRTLRRGCRSSASAIRRFRPSSGSREPTALR